MFWKIYLTAGNKCCSRGDKYIFFPSGVQYSEEILFVGHDRFECLASNFKVMDDRGRVLFSASRHEVEVGAEALRVSGEGGAVFTGSVQTPMVRADPGHDLR